MELSDYELVSLAQENNEDAINLIYKKYKPIIVKKSKIAFLNATHHGIEINDIMQEGFIGLEEAIRNFLQNDNATFYTFANLCIDRKISTYLKNVKRPKNKLLNEAIAIDCGLENIVKDNTNIERSFISKDMENNYIDDFTKLERQVFNLKVKGYSFEEIANTLNKDLKSIYNTFQRIKLKIKKNIENDD